jgi:hypothetical protein
MRCLISAVGPSQLNLQNLACLGAAKAAPSHFQAVDPIVYHMLTLYIQGLLRY